MKRLFSFRSSLLMAMLLAFLFSFVMGCALLGIAPESDREIYLTAVKEYTLTLEKYNAYYVKANDTTKADWKRDIDPWFKKANDALGIWALTLNNGGATGNSEEAYLVVKQELFTLLLTVFKVEGGD